MNKHRGIGTFPVIYGKVVFKIVLLSSGQILLSCDCARRRFSPVLLI